MATLRQALLEALDGSADAMRRNDVDGIVSAITRMRSVVHDAPQFDPDVIAGLIAEIEAKSDAT